MNHRMERVNFPRMLLLAGVGALLVSYALLWWRMMTDPVENTGSDFITYYTVGVISGQYGLEHAYDFELQKAVEEQIVGFEIADSNVMPHNHIPLLNPLLALLSRVSGGHYLLAMNIWALTLLMLYALAVRTLLRVRAQLLPASFVNFLALMLFFPLFVSLMNGQDTVLLVLGAVLLVDGVENRRDWLAGLGLALMTVRPQIALMIALPFIFARSRIWWRFVLFGSMFVMVSVLPLGLAGLSDFFAIMSSAVVGSKDAAMFNIIGFLSRSFPDLAVAVIQGIGWVAYGLAAVGFCLLAWKRKRLGVRSLGLAFVVSLLVSPHLVYHDLTLLLVPLVILLWLKIETGRLEKKDAARVVVFCSLFLLLSFTRVWSQYAAAYLFMAALLFLLLPPGWLQRRSGIP